ncbi:MAG TPA: hypothetical protein VNL13_03995 [Sulfolobales archaeon]|nr:hypothetical protein [Sulfolobales archaeon]
MGVSDNLIDIFSRELLVSGALTFGEYRLRSGRISPYYIDLRILISKPRLLSIAVELISRLIDDLPLRPTKLCGIPMTGALIVSAVAVSKNIPGIYIRKEPMIYRDLLKKISEDRSIDPGCVDSLSKILGGVKSKTHGISRLVDGVIDDGDKILLVDDVITTGDTKIEAIEILEEEARKRGKRIEILGVAVLIDREEGGEDAIVKKGISLYRAVGVRRIIKSLEKQGLIDKGIPEDIERYLRGVPP